MKFETIKEKLIAFWNWLKSLFITYYQLRVSYNHTWGDADDQEFIVKKFIKKQEKFLASPGDALVVIETPPISTSLPFNLTTLKCLSPSAFPP